MTADIHTLTGAYAIDAVSDEERDAFEDHLAECAACRREVAEFRETAVRLGCSVAATPPPALKSAVLGQVRQVRQLPPEQGPIIPIRGRRWPIRVASLAAAASMLVAVMLGAQLVKTQNELEDTTTSLAQTEGRYGELVTVLTASDARANHQVQGPMAATLIVSRSQGAMAFIPHAVKPLGKGKTYQLWLIGPGGASSAGLMDSPQPVVGKTVKGADRFGVTVEPEGGSEQPTSTPVMLLAMP